MKESHPDALDDESTNTDCYPRLVKCLLKYDCNIEEQLSIESFNRILHIAIKKEFEPVVKSLVKKGADIYFRDESGDTALTLAEKYANDQIYYALVYTEVDVNEDPKSFLKISIILFLLKSFYANYFPSLFYTYESICKNPIDVALLLLNNYLIIKDFFIDAHKAIVKGYKDIVNIIISCEVNINIRDKFGRLLLHCACYHGNENAVHFLLSLGADVNKLDAYHRTPLHMAIAAQEVEIVKILIKNGANVHVRKYGRNLLYSTVNGSQTIALKLLKILTTEGIDVNDGLQTKLPLLHFAVQENYLDTVQFLLKHGANVNNCNIQGETSLHISITSLGRQIDCDIDIEEYYDLFKSTNENSLSVKWYQKEKDKEKMTLLLLKYAADINAVDNNGKTPLTSGNVGTFSIILLLKHLAILHVKKMYINEINLKFINENSKSNAFFIQCEAELNLMKSELIFGNTLFYNILCDAHANTLDIHTKNNIIKEIIINSEYWKLKFPIYFLDLRNLIIEGKERKSVLKSAAMSLNNYFQFRIPYIIVEKIVLYLTYEDWINIIKS